MFPNIPVQTDRGIVKIRWRGSNRITIRKMFDAEREELTKKISQKNIP